mgnify:CR=1 FL=1
MKYLIDTSALYPLILTLRDKILLHTDILFALDLTIYEVGNALWREYRRGRIKNLKTTVPLFQEALNSINTLKIDNIDEVLKIAIDKNITFYDASYIYVAEKTGLKLVTEDKEILEKYGNAINLKKMLEEIGEKQFQT